MKTTLNNHFDKGAKWEHKTDKNDTYIVNNVHDKFNVKTTSARIISKNMLNKNYNFIGLVDLSNNNKKAMEKTFSYWNDCGTYRITCVCGAIIRGWSEKECEDNFEIHFCEKPKKASK